MRMTPFCPCSRAARWSSCLRNMLFDHAMRPCLRSWIVEQLLQFYRLSPLPCCPMSFFLSCVVRAADCLAKLGLVGPADLLAVGTKVFPRYMALVRKLQRTYWLGECLLSSCCRYALACVRNWNCAPQLAP